MHNSLVHRQRDACVAIQRAAPALRVLCRAAGPCRCLPIDKEIKSGNIIIR